MVRLRVVKFGVLTNVEEWHFSGDTTPPSQRGGDPASRKYLGTPACVHTTEKQPNFAY